MRNIYPFFILQNFRFNLLGTTVSFTDKDQFISKSFDRYKIIATKLFTTKTYTV